MEMNRDVLMIQVHFVNEVLNRIYRKNGFNVIPLDEKERKLMIDKCKEDIVMLFRNVLKSYDEAEEVMKRFQSSSGLVLLFLVMLNGSQLMKILSCNWSEIRSFSGGYLRIVPGLHDLKP